MKSRAMLSRSVCAREALMFADMEPPPFGVKALKSICRFPRMVLFSSPVAVLMWNC